MNVQHEWEKTVLTLQVSHVEKPHVYPPPQYTFVRQLPSYEERLLSSDPSVPPLSLKECEEMMARLKEKYPEEYIIYSLSSVAVAMVFPLVKNYLQVTVDY